MRIALSGTHRVGKSTLAADLHRLYPDYRVVDEPYYELLDEGALFAERPCIDDFVAQLERSIATLNAGRAPDVIFDRCPTDFIAYLGALGADDAIGEWLPAAGDALSTLDLIVFVPIEQPDRIDGADSDSLRRKVDDLLREILLDDSYGFGRPVITVQGAEDARAAQLVAALQRP